MTKSVAGGDHVPCYFPKEKLKASMNLKFPSTKPLFSFKRMNCAVGVLKSEM